MTPFRNKSFYIIPSHNSAILKFYSHFLHIFIKLKSFAISNGVDKIFKLCYHFSRWPHRLAWPRTPDSHSGDRGSNPLGATIAISHIHLVKKGGRYGRCSSYFEEVAHCRWYYIYNRGYRDPLGFIYEGRQNRALPDARYGKTLITSDIARVAERQTHQLEGLAGATLCEFKSRLAHHKFKAPTHMGAFFVP